MFSSMSMGFDANRHPTTDADSRPLRLSVSASLKSPHPGFDCCSRNNVEYGWLLLILVVSHCRLLRAHEAGVQALRLPRQQGGRLGGGVRRRVLQERLLQDLQLPVSMAGVLLGRRGKQV